MKAIVSCIPRCSKLWDTSSIPVAVGTAARYAAEPVWAAYGEAYQAPSLLIVPAYQPGHEDDDPLDQKLTSAQYDGQEVPELLKKLTRLEVASEALFGADNPPRHIILVGFKEWLRCRDRYKWPNNRLLRFDWTEILDRKDTYTLQAAAALLHHESLAPEQGASLLDGLDENAHKHAFGVSEDLKYALRESIEILGNEAVKQLRQRAQERSKDSTQEKMQSIPETSAWNACAWSIGCSSCSTLRPVQSLDTSQSRRVRRTPRDTVLNPCAI